MRPRSLRWLVGSAFVLLFAALPVHATGARSFKSGPIQITVNGTRVWVVNPDHDGSWYSHAAKLCQQTPSLTAGRREVQLTPASGSAYYLVTSYDLCQESISGTDSTGSPQPAVNLTCAP